MKNNKFLLLIAILGFAFNMYASDTKDEGVSKAIDIKEEKEKPGVLEKEIKTDDNKIIKAKVDDDGYLRVERYNSDGTPDLLLFNAPNGFVIFLPVGMQNITLLSEDADGKITVAGKTWDDRTLRVRFLSDGMLDTLFFNPPNGFEIIGEKY